MHDPAHIVQSPLVPASGVTGRIHTNQPPHPQPLSPEAGTRGEECDTPNRIMYEWPWLHFSHQPLRTLTLAAALPASRTPRKLIIR
jgi:hypothetical protein